MSVDWSGLQDLGLKVESILIWPGPATPDSARRESPFKATRKVKPPEGETRWVRGKTPFAVTVKDLRRELEALSARAPVLRLALSARDVRQDGYPRADARLVHPGVMVVFQARAVRGQPELTYAVDSFLTWQDNLRAAALGMEAQRKLKRYGIAQLDQQYAGYRALPMATSQSPEEAKAVLLEYADLRDGEVYEYHGLFKRAAKRAQRDEGAMNAVMNAARTLGVVT